MTTHRSIPCPACQVVLNLPEWAASKKLKCPKCGAKFRMTPGDGRSPSSTFLLQSFEPTTAQERIIQQPGQETHPAAAGDLRETFGLPLLNEVAAGPAARPAPASQEANDALALFTDGPGPARRPDAAAARSQPRRCPTCGGGVPAGMSLCSTCGLDLETGIRVTPNDDLMPEVPPWPAGPPLDVAIFGGVCLLASLILALASAVGGPGWGYFAPVCLFGAFASVQFLRGRSARLLLSALSIAAVVDVVALVALPLVEANLEPTIIPRAAMDRADAADVAIGSVADRLDTRRLW